MRRLAFTSLAVAAMLAGFYLSARYYAEPEVAPGMPPSSDLVGRERPDFRLGSATGEHVTAQDFAGKTLLINFWATWCEPCRREMPMLVDLQREYADAGLQVIGIALDDVQSARDFAENYGISYPILVGSTDVMLTSHEYGNANGVLPYSVLVDKHGIVRWQYAGEIQAGEIESLLRDIL